MVTEPQSGRASQADAEAWQRLEKLRIAAKYPYEDNEFAETILDTPWRDTLEADVQRAYEEHMSWAAAVRAEGNFTFPSDELFWMNVELLLPDYAQFLSKAKRETSEGRAFIERAEEIYPTALGVIERMDIKQ